MRARIIVSLIVFAFMGVWFNSSVEAEVVAVNFQLNPSVPPVNNLKVEAQTTIFGVSVTESDNVAVTGNALTDLGVDVDAVSPADTKINSLSFAGGMLNVEPFNIEGDFGLFGSVRARGRNIVGTANTPSPPAPVVNGQFDVSDHNVILNGGTVEVTGSGAVGSLFDPITIDLAKDPFVATTKGTGTINNSLSNIERLTAYYDSQLSLPVKFEERMMLGNVPLDITGDVLLRGSGQYSVQIPEPSAFVLMILLVLLAMFLVRRRKSGS